MAETSTRTALIRLHAHNLELIDFERDPGFLPMTSAYVAIRRTASAAPATPGAAC